MSVIEAQEKRMRAPMHAAGEQWHVGVECGRLVYQDERGLDGSWRRQSCSGGINSIMPVLAIATLRAIEAFKIGMPAFEAVIVTPNGRR